MVKWGGWGGLGGWRGACFGGWSGHGFLLTRFLAEKRDWLLLIK